MRVVHWTPHFPPDLGGIETAIQGLTAGLQEHGVETMILTDPGPRSEIGETRVGETRVVRLPMMHAIAHRDLREIKIISERISSIYSEWAPHLSHLHLGGGAALSFHQRLGGSYVVTIHGCHLTIPAVNGLLGRVLMGATAITAVSNAARESLQEAMPALLPEVIYLGAETGETEPTPSTGAPTLLCASRLVVEKGVDIALTAFAFVRAQIPEARLVVAGEGSEMTALITLADALGVGDSVDFVGAVDAPTMRRLNDSSTLFVAPSRVAEGFGQAALEASFAGRPVVASRLGGLTEAVVDTETGMLVPAGDPRALAEAVLVLLKDRSLANRLGRQGHERASREFSRDRTVNRFAALYRGIA